MHWRAHSLFLELFSSIHLPPHDTLYLCPYVTSGIKNMEDVARNKLNAVIEIFGTSIIEEPDRLKSWLLDCCPSKKKEIKTIVDSAMNCVPQELLKKPQNVPVELVFARLEKRLVDDLGISEDNARWAVESWGIALGIGVSKLKENKKVRYDKLLISGDVGHSLTRLSYVVIKGENIELLGSPVFLSSEELLGEGRFNLLLAHLCL